MLFEDEELSYRELNERANRLARHLIHHGAGPEQLVALALPRSLDLIVALLAVLKSGAGYVPVDPDYPADRIAYMLQDAHPVLILTDTTTATRLPPAAGDTPLVLTDDNDTHTTLNTLPAHNVTDSERATPLLPHHPAYVIYTSGSTGRPKGVVIEHRALVNYVAALSAGLSRADGAECAARLGVLRRRRDRAVRGADLRRPGTGDSAERHHRTQARR